MKKQLIAAIAISLSMLSFAQKKELKAAEKAVKSANFADAKKILAPIKFGDLDDNLKAKYNYIKGLALYANGAGNDKELKKGANLLNRSRKVYKEQVDAFKTEMLGTLLAKGNKSFEDKEFAIASLQFERAYDLKKKDTSYLYYAASSAINVPDYDRALKLYVDLKDLGYTGIKTSYYAEDIATGLKVLFANKKSRNRAVARNTHKKPTQEKSESVRADIVKKVALIYTNKGNTEKAIEAIRDARAISPEDFSLILAEANIYLKTGDTDNYKKVLKEAIDQDPNNSELFYNLGIASTDLKEYDEAENYYKKAIELDPKNEAAYINLGIVILKAEPAILEEINSLGNSAADNKRYDELLAKRKGLYGKAIPYFEQALSVNPKSLSAATTLMNIYGALNETAKKNEMEAKVEAIKAAQ